MTVAEGGAATIPTWGIETRTSFEIEGDVAGTGGFGIRPTGFTFASVTNEAFAGHADATWRVQVYQDNTSEYWGVALPSTPVSGEIYSIEWRSGALDFYKGDTLLASDTTVLFGGANPTVVQAFSYCYSGGGGGYPFGSVTVSTIPEPSAIVLLTSGLLGLLAYAWRKRK